MEKRLSFLYFQIGYYISLFGIILILLWLGIFKFTPKEAQAIQPLIDSHFLFSGIYNYWDIQIISNIIGVVEILIAAALIFGIKFSVFNHIAAFGIISTFLVTLSFLFTTPNIFREIDGVLITDFFILKDLLFLGFGFIILSNPLNLIRK